MLHYKLLSLADACVGFGNEIHAWPDFDLAWPKFLLAKTGVTCDRLGQPVGPFFIFSHVLTRHP